MKNQKKLVKENGYREVPSFGLFCHQCQCQHENQLHVAWQGPGIRKPKDQLASL